MRLTARDAPDMRQLPRGTVTLLFTDIEGSTRLLQKLGGEAYVGALKEHRRLLREAFSRFGGVEVEMQGDSFHYAFQRAEDAVRAAEAGQRALAEHEWQRQPIRVRVGVHTGEPVVSDDLYAGLDVHRAARVMSAGHGGQVLLSQTTRDLLDDEFELQDLGQHRLRDLSRPIRIYQLGVDDFPPLNTLDATNLPIAASPLVGRQPELEEALALMKNGTRLLTVTGPGGTGKTRFALQLAAELVDTYRDGVFWVPLAGLSDPDLVLPAIGQTLGARGELAEHIRDKQSLVLLDNAEHLLGFAPKLADILAVSTKSRFLVTSRAPLHLAAEHEFPLEPLAPSDASTLFVERARAAGRKLDRSRTIDAICLRLDGLPLALELAAARTKVLAPEKLLERLDRALPLLTAGPRDAPERQRTLSATIEWSYELLDDDAKQLLARLSVFGGSFSLDAAEVVADANLDTLARLVDLNLLKPFGDDRFLMLETIREYALTQLESSGEAERWRRRHDDHFGDLLTMLETDVDSESPNVRARAVARVDLEMGNLRVALDYRLRSGAPTSAANACVAFARFLVMRPAFGEARVWLERALVDAANAPPITRARVLRLFGYVATMQGAYDHANRALDEALSLYRRHGIERDVARTLLNLGYLAVAREEFEDACPVLEEASHLFSSLALESDAVGTGDVLAMAFGGLGKHDRADALMRDSVAFGRRVGDAFAEGVSLVNWGEIKIARGEYEAAEQLLRDGLTLLRRLDPRDAVQFVGLEPLAEVAAFRGDFERASYLFGAADGQREQSGAARFAADRRVFDRATAIAYEALGRAAFEEMWARGKEATLEDAIAVALREGDPGGPGSRTHAGDAVT